MSHRKIRSQGYIPFSWEEKPGVPKISHQKSSSDIGLNSLKIVPDNFSTMSRPRLSAARELVRDNSMTTSSIIPPPPLITFQPPRKSHSRRLQDDPFLVALKSCSDSVSSRRGSHEELRQGNKMNKGKTYNKSSVFSCKQSCNVENDNLVKFSKLPPIPKERYNAKSFVRSSLQ